MMGNEQNELPADETALEEGLAAISTELFGEAEPEEVAADSGEEVGEEGQEGAEGSPTSDSPPASETAEEQPAEVVKAPDTWTAEAAAEFGKLPPVVQKEVLKREQDILRGIEGYKEAASVGKAYQAVVQPYAAELASQNIDPVELFKNFAGNHYVLAKGTPEQKVELAANLLKSYGINPEEVAARVGTVPYVDPELAAMRQELAQLREGLVSRQAGAVQQQVEQFAADPANIYFSEVADDIAQLLKSGSAKTLPEAYEKAIWLNPATRAKEVARQQAAQQADREAAEKARLEKAAAAQSLNVKARPNPRGSTVPVGSIDDTLNETYQRLIAG